MKNTIISLVLSLFAAGFASGQSLWAPATLNSDPLATHTEHARPAKGNYFALDFEALVQHMRVRSTGSIQVPLPDGQMLQLTYTHDPVMAPGLQSRFPEIATYAVKDPRHPAIQGRIDHTPRGFHAMIRYNGRTLMIDPAYRDRTDLYAVYYQDEYWADPGDKLVFECLAHDTPDAPAADPSGNNIIPEADLRSSLLDLREYRIAIATTAEYSLYHGGTVPLVLAELASVVNRTNQIFINDAGVRIKLIDNNDQILFFDPATDGYTNGNAAVMINENPGVISQYLELDEYDVGHVFGRFTVGPAIGIAQTPSVCTNAKARGASNGQPPKFDPFVVNVFCHELGHQFSAQHSFNKCDEQNENPPTGWEPGSGSTIMSYNGACGTNNVQSDTDPYFHSGNITQMRNYTRSGNGNTCGVDIPTSNQDPVIEWPYENGFYIPVSTPFVLEAGATDPDNDPLTYCWEQMDTGPITDAGNPVQNSPLFRSFLPTDVPSRTFPQLFRIVSGVNTKFEVLPTYSRDMTFRFTVRDNNPEVGAVVWETVAFRATDAAGPFVVSKFNTVDSVIQGSYTEVTWNVANTDQAPVHCQSVNILLSTDGGFNYPYLLAEDVPNDGSHFVTIPNTTTNSGRIKVEAADNIFFDISNANLRIRPALEPGFSLDVKPYSQIRCIPHFAEITIQLEALLGFSEPVTLSVQSGLPDGATVMFSQNPATGPAIITALIDLSTATETGLFEVVIQGEANGVPVLTRSVFLDIYRSDYSSLNAVFPAPGASSIGTSPVLEWVDQPDASSYTVELATNPAFGASVIFSESGITTNSYQPSVVLEESALYFWRVIPENICGQATDVPVYAFHTITLSCAEASNTSTYLIPAQGTQIVESPIELSTSGNVGTLRVKNIKGNHANFGHLRGNLRAPNGTSVRLFSSKCFQISGNFFFSINDDSPIPFTCPPDKGETYQSQEMLGVFNGLDLNGTWTFVLEDILTGSGGQLAEWTLEYCSDVALNPPVLVTNETLLLKPATEAAITSGELLCTDADNGPEQLVYTVVRLPQKGELRQSGTALEVGQTFTQQDIIDLEVTYTHSGTAEEEDNFLFTVEDGTGGWLGIETFAIRTDESVSVQQEAGITPVMAIWPNPAGEQCRIKVEGSRVKDQIMVVNALGQPMPVHSQVVTGGEWLLDVRTYPEGLYVVILQRESGVLSGKFLVTRS